MTYRSLMVHPHIGRSNAALLEATADLAERFGAKVIGVVVCQMSMAVYANGYVSPGAIQMCQDEMDREVKTAEQEFHELLGDRVSELQWHGDVLLEALDDYVIARARTADLVIVNPDGAEEGLGKHVPASDVLMNAGRPLFVIPSKAVHVTFRKSLVYWKDTRECRRAIVDALPVLKVAGEVHLVEVAPASSSSQMQGRLADVASWLKQHGVAANAMARYHSGNDATQLCTIAAEEGADIVVAGAFGHSRLREWVFGGVKHSLLNNPAQCTLLSH